MIHLEWCYDLYGQLNYFILGYTVLFFSFQVLAKLRPRDGFAGLKRISMETRERYWKREHVGGFLAVYAAIPPFLSIYSSLKQAIPIIYPFSWDDFFMKMDFNPLAGLEFKKKDKSSVLHQSVAAFFIGGTIFAGMIWTRSGG
jgi:hypothetical protein